MERYRVWAAAWLAAAAICWTGTAYPAEPIVGTVLAVRGAVFADTGGGSQTLTVNAPLRRSDTITTNAGKAKIALNDGTVISIAENTRLRLADYDKASSGFRTRLALISGAMRVLVAKITPAGRFEVETETAIAAVRGTDWVIETTPAGTAVAVLRGAVAVSSLEAPPQSSVVLRSPGQGTDVAHGKAPTPPKPWGAERLANIITRTAFD